MSTKTKSKASMIVIDVVCRPRIDRAGLIFAAAFQVVCSLAGALAGAYLAHKLFFWWF